MAASAFMVFLPDLPGYTLRNGANMVICWAEDATQAKAMAKSAMAWDGNTMWDGATATPVVIGTEYEGWTFTVLLTDPVTPFTELSASYVGVNAATIDTVGTGIAAALNALTAIAGAAYDTGTNVLTIVETTDGMGDWAITLNAYPPAASHGDPTVPITGIIGAIDAAGAAGIARTCTLVAGFPTLYGAGKKVAVL